MDRKYSDIGGRLRELRGKLSQQKFAYKIGTTLRTYQHYESGERVPDVRMLSVIAKNENVTTDWILTGDDRLLYKEMIKKEIEVEQLKEENAELDRQIIEKLKGKREAFASEEGESYGDFIFIPQVMGEISAGGGLVPDNTVEMRIAFRREWIQRRGDAQNMSLIRVSGDSMEPSLISGDLVLIDHNRNFIDPQGGIYAISLDNTIMIKRLQVIYPGQSLKIISDNSRYEPLEVAVENVRINGKVIWFGREIER